MASITLRPIKGTRHEMSKKLVAYFSATGTTKKVAEELAKEIGADLFEIEPPVKYSDADLNWQDKKARSTVEMNDKKARPAIKGEPDVSGYDVIYIGFPIWWYTAPRIIDTYLDSIDLKGKKIALFATSGGSQMGNTVSDLKAAHPGADIVDGKRFPASASGKDLRAWAEQFRS